MRKRILVLLMALMLCTGSVLNTEIRAEAAATTTVTVVSVAKAVLVLLAIAGVGIAAGTIFDQGEIDESAVSKFTNWLNNHDPEFYTAFMLMATNIVAGRAINTMDALFYAKAKQYTREYFGTDTSVTTSVGSYKFSIDNLAIMGNDSTKYFDYFYGGRYYFQNTAPYQVIPVSILDLRYNQYCLFFMPVASTLSTLPVSGGLGIVTSGGSTINGLTYGGMSNRWTRYWEYTSTNFPVFDAGDNTGNSLSGAYQAVLNSYYSGSLSNIENDVVMKPFTTVGNVAATSVDATVVGAGQTITEDQEGEIVIDGDTTLNLSHVNIDEWLKSLAEGTQTYAQAMQAIGLAAVNTQTQTLEEVQAIVQALNPAAAGTGSITGNYTVALSDLFPFCIPFDLYNIVNCFKADPVAPSATITIPVGYDGSSFTWEDYQISLEAFDTVAAVVRVLEYVLFIIGLMLITRRLIEG